MTNAEFSKFVEATGYVTTAERKIDWEDLKKEVIVYPVRSQANRWVNADKSRRAPNGVACHAKKKEKETPAK